MTKQICEVRVPSLDPDLASLAARIPDHYRQHGMNSKWIRKKAMEGVLSKEVIFRPKTGFGVPLRAWLRGPLKPMMRELLSDNTIHQRGFLDPAAVSQLVSQSEHGQADHAYSILSLMCIKIWCSQIIDGRNIYM